MNSIYLELLDVEQHQSMPIFMDTDGFFAYGDEEEDENRLLPDKEPPGDLIYMPLEQNLLFAGAARIGIRDIHFCCLYISLPDSKLRSYIDGCVYRKFPLAVSFLMAKEDYAKYAEAIQGEDTSLVENHSGNYHLFRQGKQIMACSAGDDVRMIMGFAREEYGDGPVKASQ